MRAVIIIIAAMFLAGGAMQVNAQDDKAGKEITVSVGDARTEHSSAIEIKFLTVLEDSRCPEGVNCIWAGNAKIRIEVSRYHKTSVQFELETNGTATNVEFDRFKITLIDVAPYPKEGSPIAADAYSATFKISSK